VPASKTVLVTVTAQINPTTGNTAFMSFTGCGVTSSDANSVAFDGGTMQASATYLVTCTNSGSQAFTAQYHTSGGKTAAFSNRGIIVQGVP